MAAVLRAYGHYLRQLQLPTSLDFMAEVLLANPSVTSGLAEYFETRFDPNLPEYRKSPTELRHRTAKLDS